MFVTGGIKCSYCFPNWSEHLVSHRKKAQPQLWVSLIYTLMPSNEPNVCVWAAKKCTGLSDVSVQESLVNDVSYDSPGTDPRANVSYDSPGSQTPVINQLQYPLRYLLSSVCLFVPGSWFFTRLLTLCLSLSQSSSCQQPNTTLIHWRMTITGQWLWQCDGGGWGGLGCKNSCQN